MTTKLPPYKPSSSSSLTGKASVLSLMLLIMVGGILFAAPSSTMAQQQTTTTTVAPTTTTPPLTPEEQQQQERLQNTIAATTRNLAQGQKQVDGVVYTPRWSSPVWVEPNNSLSLLFVYCLPGEFADSGQEILGGSELEVLESYSLAITNDLTGWLMVVENENQTDRLPAAVGVICSSDANEPETRVLSPQEQTEINNIIQQFITVRNTVINNVTQIINIINNVTTNGTGGVIVTPPPPSSTNGTGGTNDTGTNDTGGVQPEPLRVQAELDPQDGSTAPASYLFEARISGGTGPYTYHWDFGDGQQQSGSSQSDGENRPWVIHTYENPGTYTITVTVTDATGQTVSDSIPTLHVTPPPTEGEPTTTNDTGVETAAPPTTGGGTVSPEPEGGTVSPEPEGGTVSPETTGGGTTPPPQTTIDTLGQ